jgi:glycosyltransferase involved in cell wall biosynthesis
MSELYPAKFGRRPGLMSGIVGVVEKAAFRFADGLITVHDIYRDRIAAMAGGVRPVVGVWNVPDADGWAEIGDSRAAEPVAEREVLRLGHHGTIVERFGVITALDAVAILRRRGTPATLTILGDGDFAPQVERRIQALGLEDVVRFDRRMFVPDDLPAFSREIDIGVAPYQPSPFTEGSLPTKVMEYLALGVPAIVTGTEMVRRHLDGAVRIIGGGSAEELADAIEEMRDASVRRRYQEAGRPLAREFDWASQRGRLVDMIDGLVAARRASGRTY